MVKRSSLRICAGLLMLTASCAKLLGIEPAICDPERYPTCRGTGDAGGGATVAHDTGATLADAASTLPGDAQALSEHELACKSYCNTVQAACVESNLQYATEKSCLDICVELMRTEAEVEAAGETSFDTIECRQKAARAVLDVGGEVQNLCQSAGMWGNDECGAPCEVYCGMMSRGCSEQFAAFSDCNAECTDVPKPATILFGADAPTGNTLQCRINHIRLATTTQNPGTHCPHAAGAAGPCQP
jgi:hypothetical protein